MNYACMWGVMAPRVSSVSGVYTMYMYLIRVMRCLLVVTLVMGCDFLIRGYYSFYGELLEYSIFGIVVFSTILPLRYLTRT